MTDHQASVAQLLAAHPIKLDPLIQDSEAWYCAGPGCTRWFRSYDEGVVHQAEVLTAELYVFLRDTHRISIDSTGTDAILADVLSRAFDAGVQAGAVEVKISRAATVDELTALWHGAGVVGDGCPDVEGR